MHKETQIDLTG